MDKENTFSYSYSAKEQEEIRRIEEKYKEKTEKEDKLEKLRRLDAGVTAKGTMWAIIIGIAGTLLLGVGMCCCLVWTKLFVPGIILGVIGIAILSAAFPVYRIIIRKEKERIAPQILALTAQLKR